MKRYYYLVIGLIAALAALFYVWTLGSGPEPLPAGAQLVSVLNRTPVIPEEGVLQARVHLPGEDLNAARKAQLRALGLALLPPGASPLVRETGHGFLFRDASRGIELELKLIPRAGRNPRLLVQATVADINVLPQLESRWQEVFLSRGYEAESAALVTGTLPGLRMYNELEMLLAEIFQALAVEKAWQTTDGRFISWAGHSPRIKTFLLDVRGEPVNIQAAARYHTLDGRTHIYLGSPLIYRDF